jgi:hypothetical protein
MITCFLRYEIDPAKIEAFEAYSRVWITLVNRMGGIHHGYLMPSEGSNDVALASFSFPNLAAYEAYRAKSFAEPDCLAAFAFAKRTGCIKRYDRSFFRPVTDGLPVEALT